MTETLSEDARMAAACMWKLMPSMTLSFKRPHIVTQRARAAFDELTAAGLLVQRPHDPVGIEWEPTGAMADFTRKLNIPKNTGSFKLMDEEPDQGEAPSVPGL